MGDTVGRSWRDIKPGQLIHEIRTENVREIKELPPELLTKINEIEAAYYELRADRGRVDVLEQRMDQSDDRQMQLARLVAEMAKSLGITSETSADAPAPNTNLIIRVDQLEQQNDAATELVRAVNAMHQAMLQLANNVSARVEENHRRMDGFEQAFAQMKAMAQRMAS